ncbi:MAG: hypothetical protein HOV80_04255 [Polyangiaceae bacterium]|nr:hypothetical protein [Polyangiaceae bacterium]
MRPRLCSLLALLSSIALASCLADIPELGGGTSSSTSTATSTGASSTATGFCAGQPKEIDFCADFENDGGASLTWDDVALDPPYAHIEQDLSFGSDPPTVHAWVEPDQGGCLHARLGKHLDPDREAPIVIDLKVHPDSFGIISNLSWERGEYTCNILVRYLEDSVFLTFQGYGEGGGADQGTGIAFPHTLPSPFGQWHRVRIVVDRRNVEYNVQLDDGAVMKGMPDASYMGWSAVCAEPPPEGALTAAIGSYCIHPPNGDFATNAYFDDVTFDFEDAP